MAGILDIGVSALTAFQRSLNTTGHNIANADTVGYSRQRTVLATRTPQLAGGGWMGSGVKVADVQRLYDDFLATQIRSSQSSASELETYFSHASRIDNMLADPEVGLDPAIQDFFDALQVLATDPSSVPTRQLALSESQSMVDRFHDVSRQFNDLRHQLNGELGQVSNEINSLAESLVGVNRNIVAATGASGGASPNDLLDQREVLLQELSSLVDITVVPQDDGAWNVFIGKGQALVMGTAAATLTTVPGSRDINQFEIAFSNDVGTQKITNQLSGGELGGLLDFRDQILDPGQNQLGLVMVGITDKVNAQHQLGIDLNGQFGAAVFNSPTINVAADEANGGGVTVSAAFVNVGNLTASDYTLRTDGGADQFTLTRLTDGESWSFNTGGGYPYTYPATGDRDGFSITISGAADAGDEFLIRPTRDAAESITLRITDPRQFAAAGAVRSKPTGNAAIGGPNLGTATLSQPEISDTDNLPVSIALQWTADLDGDLTADDPGFQVSGGPGGTLAYDPGAESGGKTFTFAGYGGMRFTASGIPSEGDRFVIEGNDKGTGDNRNALQIAHLQNAKTLLGNSSGSAPTATFQEVFGQMVSDVGSKTRHAEVNARSTAGLLERHQSTLASVNGVNLDEEAANLIKYQQAYQAAAQVIAVASTVFDALIGAVRR